MAAREAITQAGIIAELNDQGAWVTKNHQSGYTRRGIPDLSAIWCGVPLCIEVKQSPTAAVRDEQIRELHAIRDAGGCAVILWDKKQVRQVLERLLADGYDVRGVHDLFPLPPLPAVVTL